MKKIALALTALAALTGSASAADLAARPYTKAPVAVAPVADWTGCYVGGGGGDGFCEPGSTPTMITATTVAAGPNISHGTQTVAATSAPCRPAATISSRSAAGISLSACSATMTSRA